MKGIQSNGFLPIIAQAIADMEAQYGEFSSIDEINLAELGRRTGLSRAKLRRLKANGFRETAHGTTFRDSPAMQRSSLIKTSAASARVAKTRAGVVQRPIFV